MEKLCKFCGKPIKVSYDHYDEYFHCECEGQTKLDKFNKEIFALERQLREKKQERNNYVNSSIYFCKKRKLESQLEDLDEKFRDDDFNPAIIEKI